MAADGRDLRIRCIARKRSAFAPIRSTLLRTWWINCQKCAGEPVPVPVPVVPVRVPRWRACVPSYKALGTLRGKWSRPPLARPSYGRALFNSPPGIEYLITNRKNTSGVINTLISKEDSTDRYSIHPAPIHKFRHTQTCRGPAF